MTYQPIDLFPDALRQGIDQITIDSLQDEYDMLEQDQFPAPYMDFLTQTNGIKGHTVELFDVEHVFINTNTYQESFELQYSFVIGGIDPKQHIVFDSETETFKIISEYPYYEVIANFDRLEGLLSYLSTIEWN